MTAAAAADDRQNAARCATAALDPLRIAAGRHRVHWVRPELVAEVKFLTWTEDNLLRLVVDEGLREDKPAAEVRRDVPHPKVESVTLPSKTPSRRKRPV